MACQVFLLPYRPRARAPARYSRCLLPDFRVCTHTDRLRADRPMGFPYEQVRMEELNSRTNASAAK